jgi:integrase
MPEKHTILGGKVHVYRRENSSLWQCATYLAGRNRRVSTKEESLARAKDFAEDWYLQLRGKARAGELLSEKTFADAAAQFEREFQIITQGQRNAEYVKGHSTRLRLHLVPFFGNMGLSQITPGQVQEYRIHRHEETVKKTGRPPARNTMHQEIVCLRQTLKTAVRHGWLDRLPDLSEPYRASGKISHRGWFSPEEYKKLYTATRERAKSPKNNRYKWESEQLHDYVLFMANTGLRPDEANRLEYRDVKIVEDEGSQETILEIEVRGKKDREGQSRTAYSLRHTYICLRLLEGADIYQIAKNCRTSVEMIEKYYASHLKNTLDAAAINVMKKKAKKAKNNERLQEEEG